MSQILYNLCHGAKFTIRALTDIARHNKILKIMHGKLWFTTFYIRFYLTYPGIFLEGCNLTSRTFRKMSLAIALKLRSKMPLGDSFKIMYLYFCPEILNGTEI